MIEDKLVSYLLANSAVNAVFAGRIYPMLIPDENDALPAIVYQLIDTERDYSHSGESNLREARLQVTAWATKYKTAKTSGKTLADALQAWKGVQGAITIETVFIDDENDLYDSDAKLYGLAIDILVTFKF